MKQEDEGKFTKIQYRCGWNCLVSVKMSLQLLYSVNKKKKRTKKIICNRKFWNLLFVCLNYPIHFYFLVFVVGIKPFVIAFSYIHKSKFNAFDCTISINKIGVCFILYLMIIPMNFM